MSRSQSWEVEVYIDGDTRLVETECVCGERYRATVYTGEDLAAWLLKHTLCPDPSDPSPSDGTYGEPADLAGWVADELADAGLPLDSVTVVDF